MESQRSFLFIGLLLVSFLLWTSWNEQYGEKPVAPIENTNPNNVPSVSSIPSATNDAPLVSALGNDVPVSDDAVPLASAPDLSDSANHITIKTDTLDLVIDLVGGDVVKANLIKFPVTQGSNDSYSILRPENGMLHIAQSGLVGKNGPDANPKGRPKYNVTATNFVLTGEELRVPLTWQSADGISITKEFVFTRGNHAVNVNFIVNNNSVNTAVVQEYGQLKQVIDGPSDGNMFMPTYRGAAYSNQEDKYQKYSFGDFDEKLKQSTKAGWVGMLEHYFVTAWVPPQDQVNNLYSGIINEQFALIGFTGTPVSIASNTSATLTSILYMGPKDQAVLENIANGLDLTVDYGILWWISQPLFTLLKFIYGFVGNWGVAIILITILVKGSMYLLTKKQYESMAKLRNLAPKMQQLKDRYGDDRQKLSAAMMEMYKKDKVNPMGGCFPLLLQMPIFLALYWVLLESVELRHADFALWITDLSTKDPYFVLPVLTGLSMYLLQKLQPMTIQDPMQQKIMQFMPVMMSIFFLWFPAGLVLYWLISNVITLIQAKIIYASMEKRGLSTK